jgi:uncharacterized protein YbjT (DUF2867 family)
MFLIVGGTSKLGLKVARLLRGKNRTVRVMTRTPTSATAETLKTMGVEVVAGDLRDPSSISAACAGVSAVLACAHAFPGDRTNNPATVDERGNRSLIAEARQAGVQHLVFVSILGAHANHEIDFFRIKNKIEGELQKSTLSYTIIRAAAFMESWATIVGEPLLKSGKTVIFGAGQNPVNFVSADDVAAYAVLALEDPRAKNRTLEVGGPENHTLNHVAGVFEVVSGRPGTKKHVPRSFMRIMSKVIRPFNPPLSRLMSTGVYMDTADQKFDMSETLKEFPVTLTRLEDFVRQTYAR